MTELTDTVTFQNYFEDDGITCFNFSTQGCSNLDILELIETNMDTCIKSNLILIFQTDPLRDVLEFSDSCDFIINDKKVLISENFESFTSNLLKDFYAKIEQFKIKHNLNIFLIGGLSKLKKDIIPLSINYLDQSWSEMVDNDFTDTYYEWLDTTLFVWNHFKKLHSWNESYSDFFEIEKRILEKNHLWQTSTMFSWCHASKYGYKLMYNCLKKTVINKYMQDGKNA